MVPGTLTGMSTSADVLPVRSAAAGGLATLGLAGWLGTVSPHTARAYQVDLRQFTGWLAAQQIPPDRVTPGVTTSWLADLAAAGQQVATRRRKLAAVLSFYRYAAAEGLALTPPVPHQVPKLHRDDADTGALDTAQARRLWGNHRRPAPHPRPGRRPAVLRPADRRSPHPAHHRPGHPAGRRRPTGHRQRRQTPHRRPPRARRRRHPRLARATWRLCRAAVHHPHRRRTGPRAAHRLIGRIGNRAGIPRLHPHTLRHTFATSAVNAGADVLKVATALGHASPSTTMRYVRGRDVITHSPVHAVAASIVNG